MTSENKHLHQECTLGFKGLEPECSSEGEIQTIRDFITTATQFSLNKATGEPAI